MPKTHTGPVSDHHAKGYFCGGVDPDAIVDEIARAVPLLGPAGSMSFHHVRLLHGSAQNGSDQSRALLLYEYAAADAWPLMGVRDLIDFDARLVAGPPSIEPRLAPAPVRMPLPRRSIRDRSTRTSWMPAAISRSPRSRRRQSGPKTAEAAEALYSTPLAI